MNDYIDGDKFKDMCETRLGESLPDSKHILMYADSDKYFEAISFIAQNHNQNFTLVTHNGDKTIESVALPNNLKSWHTINLNFQHPRVFPIPIGLENTHWHPKKRGIMENGPTFESRLIKPFAQFNPATSPKHRLPILPLIARKSVDADVYPCENGINFELYIHNLRRYAFCLCPRGNGIDTHRIWESLYMGCIPIVKRHITHVFNQDLPILFIDDWREITSDFLNQTDKNVDTSLFGSELLTMSYWKDKIKNG